MKRRRLRAAGCAALLAAAWLGCDLPPPQQRLLLPAPPESWRARFPGLACRIVWSEPGGGVRGERLPSWPAEASVALPRSAPTPVLAFPVHAGVELLPAGGLCPGERPRLRLSWRHGPVAACLLGLAAAGYPLELLNTDRLLEAADALRLDDPWHLDAALLAESILRGGMRVTDVRASQRRQVELALPAGEWIPASAAAPPIVSDGRALALLPDGFHRLFHRALPLRADVSVSGGAAAALVTAHPFGGQADGQGRAACYHGRDGRPSGAAAFRGQGSLRPGCR
jgi:hypothetical protein